MRADLLTPKRALLTIAGYALLWLAVLALIPWLGRSTLAIGDIIRADDTTVQVLVGFRLPRIILGLFAGGGLAAAGVGLQALLRNPLASPYTLGIASGGSLGAVVGMVFATGAAGLVRGNVFGDSLALSEHAWVMALSLAGSLAVAVFLYSLSRRHGRLDIPTLLLAGVTMGIIAGAGILFVRYLAVPTEVVAMDRWLMGSLHIVGFEPLLPLLVLMVPGLLLLAWQVPAFNHLAFGAELAAGQGIRVERVRRITFIAASLVTAAVVGVTGPIAFVGLIVPHAVRRLTGPDHRTLLPGAFFLGGAFLALCDGLAHRILPAGILPIGVVTALLGGPFFLVLLLARRTAINWE